MHCLKDDICLQHRIHQHELNAIDWIIIFYIRVCYDRGREAVRVRVALVEYYAATLKSFDTAK